MANQLTRGGFWAALWAFIIGIFGGSQASAATKVKLSQISSGVAGPGLMGYGSDQIGTPVSVGAGLGLSGGVLTATPAPSTNRDYGVPLVRDAGGNYPLPANVRVKPAIHVNGIRYFAVEDYSIVGDAVVPNPGSESNWPPDAKVKADGE